MSGETISHYRITRKLGEGGMGVVYQAEDMRLKRTVALKFLPPEATRDPEAKARFIHEARAASSLDHPNICTIHEIDETDDGRLFLAMACYEGETLKERIARGPLPLDEAVDITRQVAEGLAKAHERDIVHRDVKPANIFVTADGLVKILDFGLAKLSGQTQLTREGTTVGTAHYMSPEQSVGRDADRRSDLWSLGAVLYEMITGRVPFPGEHAQAVTYAVLNTEPEPATGLRTGVPLELERIAGKCLQKDPSERYQTAADLLADILHLQRTTVDVRRGRRVSEPSLAAKRAVRRWMRVAMVAAVVAAALLLYYRRPASPGRRSEPGTVKLVVLPFENLGSAEDEYFAAGMTEEITSRLGTIDRMGVISRTSAAHYASSDKTIRQIGEELDVDYALEGTVRWAWTPDRPGNVRITAQLIRTSDDTHLWAESYNRVLEDIFEVQSDIAHQVVRQLGIVLHKDNHPTLDFRPTDNLEAYQAYLRGRYYADQPHFSAAETQRALDAFQQAVELDPAFTLAYTAISRAHARFYYYRYDPTPQRRQMARSAIDAALELEPDSPRIRLALGYYHLLVERDPDRALEEFARAAAELPESGEVLEAKADALRMQGRWDAALENYRSASELNPRSASPVAELSMTYWWMRRYPEALHTAERAITLAPDQIWPRLAKIFCLYSWKGELSKAQRELPFLPADHPWTYWVRYWHAMLSAEYAEALACLDDLSDPWLRIKICARPKPMFSAWAHALMGQPQLAAAEYDSARLMLEREVHTWPDDPRYSSSLAVVYAALGRRQDAIKEAERAVEIYPVTKDAVYGLPYVIDLAHTHTILGDVGEAVARLDTLLSVPSWISVAWLEMDPRWNDLRDDPRFQALLRKHSQNSP
jgi:serine/threonine protein kinase/tetratricopeptide (TPR) repeat protein